MADVSLTSTEEVIQLTSVSGASTADITSAVNAHSALATGVHGVGASTVASAVSVAAAVTAHDASALAHGQTAGVWAGLAAASSPGAGNPLMTRSAITPWVGALNVADYGAVGDGSTDDTAALQATITAARALNVAQGKYAAIFFQQDKIYKTTSPLNLTNADHIVIYGNNAIIKSYGLNGKVALDMLGSAHIYIEHLHFTSDATNPPSCHVSLGRSTTGGGEGASQNTFFHCSFSGYWTAYAIYNDSCELCLITHPTISCSGPTTAKGGMYYAAYDDESIPSDFVTRSATHSAAITAIEHANVGCANTLTQFVPFFIGHQAAQVAIRDSFGYTYNSMPVLKTYGDVYGLTISNFLCEGAIDKAIYFAARAGSGTVREVLISGAHLGSNANYGMFQDAGHNIYRLTVQSSECVCSGNASAIRFEGAVWMSKIDQWSLLDTGTVYVYDLYYSRVELVYHTITLPHFNVGNEIRAFGAGTCDIGYTFI